MAICRLLCFAGTLCVLPCRCLAPLTALVATTSPLSQPPDSDSPQALLTSSPLPGQPTHVQALAAVAEDSCVGASGAGTAATGTAAGEDEEGEDSRPKGRTRSRKRRPPAAAASKVRGVGVGAFSLGAVGQQGALGGGGDVLVRCGRSLN